MVVIDVDTAVGASLKQGRLVASGIEARIFDPNAAGYTHAMRSPSVRNCQVLVATRDAEAALHVLSIDASADLADINFGAELHADDTMRWEPRSTVIGRWVVRLTGAFLLVLAAIAGARAVWLIATAM